jgi:hypothetical protein
MKKILFLGLIFFTVCLAACVDTTQDISLNQDGSGTFMHKLDMSTIVTMAKQMGQGKDMEKAPKMDTLINFASIVDSIKELKPAEKNIVKNGTLNVLINMDDEKFAVTFNFPFKTIDDAKTIKGLIPVIEASAMKMIFDKASAAEGKAQGGNGMDMMGGGGDQPKFKTLEDFYDFTLTDHVVASVFNKARYDAVADDQSMQSMKQMSSMGAPMNSNYVINLPRPATKVEGKNAKLSADKKKVTISASSEDFFDNPATLEYRIEF